MCVFLFLWFHVLTGLLRFKPASTWTSLLPASLFRLDKFTACKHASIGQHCFLRTRAFDWAICLFRSTCFDWETLLPSNTGFDWEIQSPFSHKLRLGNTISLQSQASIWPCSFLRSDPLWSTSWTYDFLQGGLLRFTSWTTKPFEATYLEHTLFGNEHFCVIMKLVEVIKTKGGSIQGVCWLKSHILPNSSQLCCYAAVLHQPATKLQNTDEPMLSQSYTCTKKECTRAALKKTRGKYTQII